MRAPFAAALALTLFAGGARAACPTAGLPPGVHCGVKDAAAAPGGTYALDPAHTAVVARYFHIGYSWSVFRFDAPAGTLVWDPADPARDHLDVTVATASIATPVKGFAAQISGDEFLKSAAFPAARFVSRRFVRTGPTRGRIEGDLTLMGRTHPLSFDVDLVGAGPGFGHPRIGIEARASLQPADYGLPPLMTDPIELVIDAEFEKTA
ncbi:MAG TPA: YceI family protein [Caulobacteraceae bacterium]